jgi:hypothetical protein
MNSPYAPSLWLGIQLFPGKHALLPGCFGQLVFWLIVTGFSLITSPPLFAQTNDNTAPGGRRIARQEWINTLPPHPPGFRALAVVIGKVYGEMEAERAEQECSHHAGSFVM